MAAAVFAVVCCGTPGIAQPSGEDAPSQEGLSKWGPSKFLEGVPEETRKRFLAAREKALEDPKLQELRKNAKRANREFFRAVRDKMLEIDPGLAEIVRKLAAERKIRRIWRDRQCFGSLNDDEREKLIRVIEQVADDPAVAAAKRKESEAISDDERNAAAEGYRKALREAVAKVDPTITPVPEKPDPAGGPLPTRGAGGTPITEPE